MTDTLQAHSAPATRTFRAACHDHSGVEDESGAFYFATGEHAQAVLREFGARVIVPDSMLARQWRLRRSKKHYLVVGVARLETDQSLDGWLTLKKVWFERVTVPLNDELDIETVETFVRYLEADGPLGRQAIGFHVKDESGYWLRTDPYLTRCCMQHHGVASGDCEPILGALIRTRSFLQTKIPFAPEYPGNRQWNRGAAQYVYQPADRPGAHAHWNMILKHCGQDLDDAIAQLAWAQAANIQSGADYLLHWAACMLRDPFEKLPYLFFWGDQNNGKSIFWESLALLMTKGVVAADRALTNTSEFNGELADGVLAVVEEKDISLSPAAYERIKNWVTAPMLSVRKMFQQQYEVQNTLHFVQCANQKTACPVAFGDSRIVAIYVHPLASGQEIPKPILLERLKEEAPQFMRTIMDLELPPLMGRLRLPVVENQTKQRLADDSVGELAAAIVEAMHDRSTWQGTASQLPELLGTGGWPTNRRSVKAQLDKAGSYLRARGVTVDYDVSRCTAGNVIRISRS